MNDTIDIYSTPLSNHDESLLCYSTPPDTVSRLLFQRTESLLRSKSRCRPDRNSTERKPIFSMPKESPKPMTPLLKESSKPALPGETPKRSQSVKSFKKNLQSQNESPNKMIQVDSSMLCLQSSETSRNHKGETLYSAYSVSE